MTVNIKPPARHLALTLLLVLTAGISSFCQKPEDYGFRYFQIRYKGDPVDILVKSAKGEEQKKKPLLFFCQGSLPVPLILIDERNIGFGTFPFHPDSNLCKDYHIVIVGKPFVPVLMETKRLQNDYTYIDSTGKIPAKYIERNLLGYYCSRNLEVIDYLQKQPWVTKEKLVIAGHSEGSTIAAKMASESKKATQLIYSGGNPLGRMLTMISRDRQVETDSTQYAEMDFKRWEQIMNDPKNMNPPTGEPYKNMYEYSIPPLSYLEKLTMPVLVTYGTKDNGSAPFDDYMRLEMIRRKKTNFTFKAYLGTEHNFFGFKPTGQIDYDKYNWDTVAMDWLAWLRKN
jgi:dienelactone hydrolase